MSPSLARGTSDERAEPRDEVYARVRATLADRRLFPVTVVNVSPHGLMARCNRPVTAGDPICVELPVVGSVSGVIRWALGGRIGCQLDRAIEPRPYRALLAALGG